MYKTHKLKAKPKTQYCFWDFRKRVLFTFLFTFLIVCTDVCHCMHAEVRRQAGVCSCLPLLAFHHTVQRLTQVSLPSEPSLLLLFSYFKTGSYMKPWLMWSQIPGNFSLNCCFFKSLKKKKCRLERWLRG